MSAYRGATEALPPYSDIAAYCIKCGSHDAAVEYQPTLPAVIKGGQVVKPERGEHHKRTCYRCGYTWREAVLPRD